MKLPICINCFYCKTRRDSGVYCKFGHFAEKILNDVITYTPFDFECSDFMEMDSNVYTSGEGE